MPDVPLPKTPKISKAPPTGRKFPCSQCGARLDYDPAAQGLKCPYCGYVEIIARDADAEVIERDYLKYLDNLAGKTHSIKGRSSQVRCTGCGAMVLLEDQVATEQCPFCDTHLENTPEAVEDMIAPECILPFSIELRQARDKFTEWLHSLWFAPSELTIIANLGQLNGVYIPYWTYDTMTYTYYEGQRGENYTDYEYVTVRDSDGNTRSERRAVVRIAWYNVSNEIQHFFDDVLVCASHSLPAEMIEQLEPWDLAKVDPFTPAYLSGFKTERYLVGLKEGFKIAKELVDPIIDQQIRRDIGGDHQRVTTKRTKYSAITFKHLLMPVWVAVYRYHDKTFQILVNGRTGEVVGKRPWSTFKIARLAIGIAAAIGVIIFIAVQAGN